MKFNRKLKIDLKNYYKSSPYMVEAENVYENT